MRRRICTCIAVGVFIGFATTPMVGQQAPAVYEVPRTVDGHPDLQGVWANNGATPLERPQNLADKAELTDEEVAEIQARAEAIFNDESEQAGEVLNGSLFRQAVNDPTVGGFDADTGNYNTFWVVEQTFDNRTSLIVDPPNGRIPSLTEEAMGRQKAAASAGARVLSPLGPEDTPVNVRCITYGVPNLLTGYNSYFQILQSQDHVVIVQELIHDARVIPLDKPPLDGQIRQWHGDSRGHWDGDTLVIETRNYASSSSFTVVPWPGSDSLTVVERYTRVGPDTLRWEVTFDDPKTWAQPWTAMMLLRQREEAIFEYACHEGNYAMEGMLAGAQLQSDAGSR